MMIWNINKSIFGHRKHTKRLSTEAMMTLPTEVELRVQKNYMKNY